MPMSARTQEELARRQSPDRLRSARCAGPTNWPNCYAGTFSRPPALDARSFWSCGSRELVERGAELREGDGSSLRAIDDGLGITAKPGHGEGLWLADDRQASSNCAAWNARRPGTVMLSGVSSTRIPMRRKFSTTAAMRSASLMRSSDASRTTKPSSVAATNTANTGISSMSAAVVSSMTPPRMGALSTRRPPTGSPAVWSRLQDANAGSHACRRRRAGWTAWD